MDGQAHSYCFDPMGNRLSKTDAGGGINGTETYTSDMNGNTLTGGGRTNTWDRENRMLSCVNGANTSSFVCAADGILHQATVYGTTTDYVLDNSMFVRERNHATGASVATY